MALNDAHTDVGVGGPVRKLRKRDYVENETSYVS